MKVAAEHKRVHTSISYIYIYMGQRQIGSLGLCQARRRISGRCAVWLVGLVGATLDRTVDCSSLLDPAAAPFDLDQAMPASCKEMCSSQALTFIKGGLCKPLLPESSEKYLVFKIF